jgi:hypothetical protein
MNSKKFEVNKEVKDKIHSYLMKNNNVKSDSQFLGKHYDESSGAVYSYFVYKNKGIAFKDFSITIYGKNERLINRAFSRLEKLSRRD